MASTIDLREGDLLIDADNVAYPIKVVADWNMPRQSFASFKFQATKIYSAKRAVKNEAAGKMAPANEDTSPLTGLIGLPLDPLSGQQAANAEETLGLQKPTQYRQTIISDGVTVLHLIVERKK